MNWTVSARWFQLLAGTIIGPVKAEVEATKNANRTKEASLIVLEDIEEIARK
jgi:hypothetical protein